MLLCAHMQFGHILSWVYWWLIWSANGSISTAYMSFPHWRLDRAAYKSVPYLDPYAVCPATNVPNCIYVQAAYVSTTAPFEMNIYDFLTVYLTCVSSTFAVLGKAKYHSLSTNPCCRKLTSWPRPLTSTFDLDADLCVRVLIDGCYQMYYLHLLSGQ